MKPIIPSNQPSDPRVRELFLKALDIAEATRRLRFLDGACAGDTDLRSQIEDLLANHRDDSFLEHPAIQMQSTTDSASAVTVGGAAAESARTVTGASPTERVAPKDIRYFGDYEVLGEIARGGMGVVYRARQKSLNRIVALKMIRTGRLADDAEVKRFRTEAEAAANLQHPNIVAIHEIGEHEGQHYFSMDYVEGKDLAQLASSGPLPTAQAARYVKTIAESIAYAHERGTLHRDLKPHNVLIDQQDQPRITDFGLAKLTKQDSSITQEGAVMGSPSYMPPEQASGKIAEIGPHSDVYSIGAVLYHLLTGRAPFAGETAVATLRQVLEDEPTPPTSLNPKVPEDLETICLKCLQKAPSQRYETARELVEELGRFLNFEPILARPASGWRRGWSWAQKNPWVFAGAFASLVLFFACVAYGMFERARFATWRLTAGPARLKYVVDSPAILFFQLFPLMMGALYLEGKAFQRDYRKRSEGGAANPSKHLWLHVGLGLVAIAAGMTAMGLQIKAWAWSSSVSPLVVLEILSVICALGLNWLGSHRVWEAVGMHETSRFRGVVDKVVEKQLAMEWRRWSPLKLVCFALFVWPTTWGIALLAVACWAVSTSFLGFIVAVAGVFMSIGLVRLTGRALRERRRLFTHVFAPLVLAAFAFALGTLAVDSFGPQVSKTDPKLVFGVFLAAVIAATFVSLGLFFFRGPAQTHTGERRRFPVNPWIDALLGVVLFAVMFKALHMEENWRGRREWARVKAELAAKGESVDYDFFLKPAVPDAENVMAHPFMKKHFLKGTPDVPIVQSSGPFQIAALRKLPRQPNPNASGQERKKEPSSLQEILDTYSGQQVAFDSLEEALQRRHSRVDGSRKNLMSMPIPNFNSFRRAAEAYAHLCRLHLLMDQSSAALKDLRILRRIMETVLFNEPPYLGAMSWKGSFAIIYANTLEETLGAGLWSLSNLEQVQKLCEGIDLLGDLSRSLRFGERAGVLQWLDVLGKQFQFGNGPNDDAGIMKLIPDGWIDQERAIYARLFQFHLEGLDAAKHRLDADAIEAADLALETARKNLSGLHGMMSAIMMPKGSLKLHRTTAMTQTLLDQASLACGLEHYRTANGQYPETLEALMPRFASRLPHDLFDGQPLRYHRTDDGRYLLYSVGWNSKDEGGTMGAVKDGESRAPWSDETGDWVWQGVQKR